MQKLGMKHNFSKHSTIWLALRQRLLAVVVKIRIVVVLQALLLRLYSEELPVVQSVRSIPVVFSEVFASTQPTEVNPFVEKGENVQTVQSPKTRSNNFKAQHSHQLENEDNCTCKCEDKAEVKVKG